MNFKYLLLGSFGLVLSASAQTYYIAPTVAPEDVVYDAADDEEHGTREKPFATVNYGTKKMSVAATAEDPVEFVLLSGTHQITNRVVYANKGCTRLRGESTDTSGTVVDFGNTITNASLVTIDAQILNLTFTHASPTAGGENCASIRVTSGSSSGYSMISNCVFTANTQNTPVTVFFGAKVVDCAFSDNVNANGKPSCITVFSKRTETGAKTGPVMIENCRFERNASSCGTGTVLSLTQDPSITDQIVRNCTFTSNTNSAAYGIAYVTVGSKASFEGCTFEENFAQGYATTDASMGAAISGNQDSFVSVSNCTFQANACGRNGGAMGFFKSNFTVLGSSFIGNETDLSGVDYDGGAIHVLGSVGRIARSTFTGNRSSSRGGSIFCDTKGDVRTRLELTDNVFSDNSSKYMAGALCAVGADVTMTGNVFSGNEIPASENANRAGAIYFANSTTAQVSRCTFANNKAPMGGALFLKYSKVVVEDSFFGTNTIYGTDANTSVGMAVTLGEYNGTGSEAVIRNTQFVANTGRSGAIVFNKLARGELTGCTFRENAASDVGGGLRVRNQAEVVVTNGLFLANQATQGGAAYLDGATSASEISKVSFVGSTFEHNSSDNGGTSANGNCGGGAISLPTQYTVQEVLVDRCVFRDNSTRDAGGAIYMRGTNSVKTPTILIRSSVFENNSARGNGGAINLIAGNVEVDGCTFVHNRANAGANIYHKWLGVVYNSVFVGTNKVSNGWASGNAVAPATDALYLNCIQCGLTDNVTTSNFTTANGCLNLSYAELDKLAFTDFENGDYSLLGESVARDAGLTRSWMTGSKDLGGSRRVLGTAVDVGAYESNNMSLSGLVNEVDYDGEAHALQVVVEYPTEGVTLSYGESENGPWTADCSSFDQPGSYAVWYKVEADGFDTVIGQATMTVRAYGNVDLTALARELGKDGTKTCSYTAPVSYNNGAVGTADTLFDGVVHAAPAGTGNDEGRWLSQRGAETDITYEFTDAFFTGQPIYVSGFKVDVYTQSSTANNRTPKGWAIYGSTDGESWGDPLASGTFGASSTWPKEVDGNGTNYVNTALIPQESRGNYRHYKIHFDALTNDMLLLHEVRLIGDINRVASASASDLTYEYDGLNHLPELTNVTPADGTIEYATRATGPWSVTAPDFSGSYGAHELYYRVRKDGYGSVVGCVTVTVVGPDAVAEGLADLDITKFLRDKSTATDKLYVVSGDGYSGALAPQLAFDGIVSGAANRWMRTSSVQENPLTAYYSIVPEFRPAYNPIVKSYEIGQIYYNNNGTYFPGTRPCRGWDIYGRNSETEEWTLIDSQRDITWSLAEDYDAEKGYCYKTFAVAAERQAAYRQYRVDQVQDNKDGTGGTASCISEVRLFGSFLRQMRVTAPQEELRIRANGANLASKVVETIALVEPTEGASVEYRLGDAGEFSADLPDLKAVGSYKFYYRVSHPDYETVIGVISVKVWQALRVILR